MSDNDELQQIAHLRREYTKGGLRRRDLPADPLTLFERWLSQACEAKLADPTAMVVATVDEHAQPYQRIVLLKHYDEKGDHNNRQQGYGREIEPIATQVK